MAAIASLDHISAGRAILGVGAGHSGTRNLGLAKSTAKELGEGITFIKTLLTGAPVTLGAASAHLPWIKRAPPVFLAGSAGARRLMLTVSLASDPVRTVELFGEHVLSKL
jgi:alkanesulfonate monooxygenase SsuD/methylene tetrahydromethanopterin reductase-like flavin-dependent oxidoreductase (luciferase family)